MLGDISIATDIYIITGYTDMRKSIDGLCAIIASQLKEEPRGHTLYMFCGKRCDRIKVLLREPDGFVLLYKRLDVVQWLCIKFGGVFCRIITGIHSFVPNDKAYNGKYE